MVSEELEELFSENLSIETICKIENALDLAILPAEVEKV